MLALALVLSSQVVEPPTSQVTFVRFLPRSSHFVVAYGEVRQAGPRPGAAAIWNAATGKRVRRLPTRIADVYGADLSADGRFLALGGADLGEMGVFDLTTGKRVRGFSSEMQSIPTYAFLPGKPRLALIESARYTEYGSLRAAICDLPDGEPQTLTGSEGATQVAADPKGKWLAVPTTTFEGSPNIGWNRPYQVRVHIYDVTTKTLEQALPLPPNMTVADIAFSPNGKQMAVRRSDGKLSLFDTQTWLATRTFQTRSTASDWIHSTNSLLFSPDGKRLGILFDHLGMAIFNLQGKEEPVTLYAPSRTLWRTFAFGSDGRTLLLGTTDGTVEVRSAQTGQRLNRWFVTEPLTRG